MPILIMYKCKYPHLFSPIQVGNVLFRNRIFASPTGLQYSTSQNRPITPGIAYYERKMEEEKYFRRRKDQKYSKEEIQHILIGLRQAKNILTAYVMLPE